MKRPPPRRLGPPPTKEAARIVYPTQPLYQQLESLAIAFPILATHWLTAVELMEVARG